MKRNSCLGVGRSGAAAVLAAWMASGAPCLGVDNFSCTVSPTSTLSYTLTSTAPLINSSFRGQYTAAVPPATQTRTKVPNSGLFGGCSSIGATQNDPVPISGTGTANGNGSGYHPSGAFFFSMNPAVGSMAVRGMNLNMLGGGSATVAAQISNFGINSSFCSVNPGCNSFFALSGLTLPLGNAVVSSVTAVQTPGLAPGTMTPTVANEWDFSVALMLVVSTSVTFGGSPLPTAPQTVPTVLAGHVVRAGNSITLTGSVSVTITQSDPTDVPVADQPITTSGLPLCNGLNLLITATIDSTSVMLATTSNLAAGGPQVPCWCDWNGNFVFDIGDIFWFVGEWFILVPRADFNGSGAVDIPDIFDYLTGWFSQWC